MPTFPFVTKMPFNRPYYFSPKYYHNAQIANKNLPSIEYKKNAELDNYKTVITTDSKPLPEVETRNSTAPDNAIFDLFGIKLHFDDILLICLIFFLYSEGVKDEMLFISLILLLLS